MSESLFFGEGRTSKGQFAGLPDSFTHESGAKIVIQSVPMDMSTTYQQGTNKGPEAIITASRYLELYDIETKSEVYKKGIYTAEATEGSTAKEMLENAYEQTKKYLNAGKFVVTLGGEHTISFAPIRAHAEHYGRISVLQLDAHSDLQPIYEKNPWSHACVMARVKEIDAVTTTVAVGIRSMAIEEVDSYEEDNIFFGHTLYENDDWMDLAIDKLIDPVYITFDLDAFDPSLMPSTGTPEPGGLQWNQTMKFLKKVVEKRNVIGFDVVELSPTSANVSPDFVAAKLVYKLLSYIFKYQRIQ